MSPLSSPLTELHMSDQSNSKQRADGTADAIAAVAIITIVTVAMYIWLSGMPG
jgi:hypothetical protein